MVLLYSTHFPSLIYPCINGAVSVAAIIVMQGATVADLMRTVEKVVRRRCARSGQTEHISW